MNVQLLHLQNPWWRNRTFIDEDEKVKEALSQSPQMTYYFKEEGNKIIIGPRQVGKTTYFKLLIRDLLINKKIDPKNILFFSCEPLSSKNELIELIKTYFEQPTTEGKRYIFLDEITNIDLWEQALKFWIDMGKFNENRIFVSGSSGFFLKRGFERLPGRPIKHKLFLPLSFREYLLQFASNELQKMIEGINIGITSLNSVYKLMPFTEELNKHFNSFLITGGVLKAIYEYKRTESLSSETYQTYLNWVKGDMSRLNRSESILKQIVKGIVKTYSTRYSLTAIAKDLGIPCHKTVSEYLDEMEALFLIRNQYAMDISRGILSYKKNRKSFFIDPFFYNAFKGWIMGVFKPYSFEDAAKVIEGIIMESLSRAYGEVTYFYKERETDFIIKEGNAYTGIELKWQDSVKASDFQNYKIFKNRILLSKDTLKFEEVKIVPVPMFLSLF
ncbi:MAG: ATP-binding protein [Candidatus Micrarchaeota archaeon]